MIISPGQRMAIPTFPFSWFADWMKESFAPVRNFCNPKCMQGECCQAMHKRQPNTGGILGQTAGQESDLQITNATGLETIRKTPRHGQPGMAHRGLYPAFLRVRGHADSRQRGRGKEDPHDLPT